MRKIGIDFSEFPWSLYWQPQFRALIDLLNDYLVIMGWIWPFMFTAGALLFTAGGQGLDPLMWRSFNQADPLMLWLHQHDNFYIGNAHITWPAEFSNHHFLNLASEGGLCIGLAVYFARSTKSGLMKWGLLATYGGILVWGIHEGIWWLVYVALWIPASSQGPEVLSGVGELIVFSLAVLTPVFGMYFPRRYLVWMLGFYAAWVAFGFPITESFYGNTAIYGSLWANSWEDASWLWACIGFYYLERDRLLVWFERVKSIALSHNQAWNQPGSKS